MKNRLDRARSAFLVAGNLADALTKAPAAGADVIIADLADQVPLAAKAEARQISHDAATLIAAEHPSALVFTRVNAMGTPWFVNDLAALHAHTSAVVVPSVGSVEDVQVLGQELAACDRGHLGIVLGLETVRAVENAPQMLSQSGVVGCYFGANGYVQDIGGLRTAGNTEVLYARSRVVAAAVMADVLAIDQSVSSMDADLFRADVLQGRALGFHGKLCRSAEQVAVANELHQPSAEDVTRSQLLLEAWAAAEQQGESVIEFHGRIIDAASVERAEAVLARAGFTVDESDETWPEGQ